MNPVRDFLIRLFLRLVYGLPGDLNPRPFKDSMKDFGTSDRTLKRLSYSSFSEIGLWYAGGSQPPAFSKSESFWYI